jgi:D-alanyl-D-alanine carboxypeptidase
MTAAALLRLAAERRVDLEAPVRKYVAAFPHESTRVRHLISHTAGLPHYAFFDERFGEGKRRIGAPQAVAAPASGHPAVEDSGRA